MSAADSTTHSDDTTIDVTGGFFDKINDIPDADTRMTYITKFYEHIFDHHGLDPATAKTLLAAFAEFDSHLINTINLAMKESRDEKKGLLDAAADLEAKNKNLTDAAADLEAKNKDLTDKVSGLEAKITGLEKKLKAKSPKPKKVAMIDPTKIDELEKIIKSKEFIDAKIGPTTPIGEDNRLAIWWRMNSLKKNDKVEKLTAELKKLPAAAPVVVSPEADTKIAELTAKITVAQKEIDDLTAKLRDEGEKHQKTIDGLNVKIAQLTDDKRSIEKATLVVQTDLANSEIAVKTLTDSIIEKDDEIADLKAKVDVSEELVKTVKAQEIKNGDRVAVVYLNNLALSKENAIATLKDEIPSFRLARLKIADTVKEVIEVYHKSGWKVNTIA